MPFRSKKQMRWMFHNMPDKAKEWADETPNIDSLPEQVTKNQKLQMLVTGKRKRKKKI